MEVSMKQGRFHFLGNKFVADIMFKPKLIEGFFFYNDNNAPILIMQF